MTKTTQNVTHYGTGEVCPDCGKVHTACQYLGEEAREGDAYSLTQAAPGKPLCPACKVALMLAPLLAPEPRAKTPSGGLLN